MKKTIVITAGGTNETIDGVRGISNTGTGTLASRIAEMLINNKQNEIEKLIYIASEHAMLPYIPNVDPKKFELITIKDTNDLKNAVTSVLTENDVDAFIHAMAVSDYTVDYVTNSALLADSIDISAIKDSIKDPKNKLDRTKKISSNAEDLIIRLIPTPKIIGLVKSIRPSVNLIGFKLLNSVSEEELCDVAFNLLTKNKCDYVVANDFSLITEFEHPAIIIDKFKNKTYVVDNREIAIALMHCVFDN
jgi:phosphopantothenate-cysteine ligase